MTNQLKLAWGLVPPEGVSAAWGARAIYTYNRAAYDANHTKRGAERKRGLINYFNVDLLHDRKSMEGDPLSLELLCAWLDKVGLLRLIKECNERFIMPDSEDVVEFTDGLYSLRATPRASHGYLYIGAWVVS